MLKDNMYNSSPINISLETYIKNLNISDKGTKVFTAYKISLNKSKKQIINILGNDFLTEEEVILNKMAYKISLELEDEMKDINYKVQEILEGALGIEHNYINFKAA